MVMPLRMQLVRGSFFPAADDDVDAAAEGAGGGAVIMDAAVWGRMPEELMWEVLWMLPAVKLFQLRVVSRKWRQVLTSAQFRRRLTESEQQHERGGVVACVHVRPGRPQDRSGSASATRSSIDLKAWEVDLSFVPSWFWSSRGDSYSVVATGDGVMCISNDSELQEHGEAAREANRYCVINPLTRTCVVLPDLPFLASRWVLPAPGSIAVAILGAKPAAWHFATYDWALAAAAGTGGGGWEATSGETVCGDWPHVAAVLGGGESYWYSRHDNSVHLMAPGAGGQVEEVGAVAAPSVALLGVDEASVPVWEIRTPLVLAHLRVLYFVAELMPTEGVGVMCGVWRLARDQMEWEGVALLDYPEMGRLTCFTRPEVFVGRLCAAYGVRELLCCHWAILPSQEDVPGRLTVSRREATDVPGRLAFSRREWWVWLLGLNLDTCQWELLHREQGATRASLAMGLRPHLFLSSQG